MLVEQPERRQDAASFPPFSIQVLALLHRELTESCVRSRRDNGPLR
jgi:hypothetical protein